MLLENNKYLEIHFHTETKTIELKWFSETTNMDENDYKRILLRLAGFVEQYKAKKWLGDTSQFAFPINPQLQEWTALEFNSKLVKTGLQKMALVLPEEFISQLSVGQTVDEMEVKGHENQFITNHFSDVTSAKAWLNV